MAHATSCWHETFLMWFSSRTSAASSSVAALSARSWLTGPVAAARPRKLLPAGCGPGGDPPATPAYLARLKVLATCLKGVPGVDVAVVKAIVAWREGAELMQRADDVVLF